MVVILSASFGDICYRTVDLLALWLPSSVPLRTHHHEESQVRARNPVKDSGMLTSSPRGRQQSLTISSFCCSGTADKKKRGGGSLLDHSYFTFSEPFARKKIVCLQGLLPPVPHPQVV